MKIILKYNQKNNIKYIFKIILIYNKFKLL